MATKTKLGTRAVLRSIDAGCAATCAACLQHIKFSAKVKRQQVICNVYEKGKWARIEHFHQECYVEAGNPHGEAS